ncbi:lipoate--protein ligase family protein [Arthrobacter gengyunqii]|uniref:Lipoate--protein ligase family protein n=1 Tax=Arthrobacter gengyunqii TaxID=2886940 RepID=A0A9X1M3E1_9MICC|nr:lipoate--protein ligase family protein [Arthrobacter gengyunqii]MCC3270090.1 lipoate--protein ligase family protein [Arthrobacter gengyunqii]UOY94996.1 lipoate--protein ligase family protein [Arthrobacter gengyunqii]
MSGDLFGPAGGAATPLTVVRQHQSLGAAEDLDFALAMLAAAKQGELGPTLRVYRPQPTVALGQRDARLPGFDDAARACRLQGFEPLVRKAGGRAAAYHQGCLILDHVEPGTEAVTGSRERFAAFGEMYASALRRAGADAAVGEISGEYCPGEFTVHGTAGGGRKIKLVGTAQRVVSGAWLFSSVFVVQDAAPLRRVLTECYSALGLDWNPETAGAAEDTGTVDLNSVEAALIEAYAACVPLATGNFDALAHALQHGASVSGAAPVR